MFGQQPYALVQHARKHGYSLYWNKTVLSECVHRKSYLSCLHFTYDVTTDYNNVQYFPSIVSMNSISNTAMSTFHT